MRRNHSDIAATDLDEYSRGVANEYPRLTNNYDEDDDEVPMFEPDDEELEEEKELRGSSGPRSSSSSDDSAQMSDTGEGVCIDSVDVSVNVSWHDQSQK